MSNYLFRKQVSQLFEKLAWPYAPHEVASGLAAAGNHGLAGDVLRGQSTVDTAKAIGEMGVNAAKAVGRGASRVLAPAHAEGSALAGELGQFGRGLMNRPGLVRAGAGALLLAPIMSGALHSTQQKREDELMNLQMSPERGFDKLSSLDRFLQKKAFVREKTAAMGPDIRNSAYGHLTEGVGKGIGGGIAEAIIKSLGGGIMGIHNSLIVDPKRKKLFESVVRSDPVVSDALTRNPTASKTVGEAFETMVRFAPSLSLDVNAVRSFLREAVVGGAAGVNYATIKSLIETEKALSAGGGHR